MLSIRERSPRSRFRCARSRGAIALRLPFFSFRQERACHPFAALRASSERSARHARVAKDLLFTHARPTEDIDILIERTEGIPLIGIDDLIETKRTGGLQDAADIEALEAIRRLR